MMPLKQITTTMTLGLLFASVPTVATSQSSVQQLKQILGGSKLTNYHSDSNFVMDFCSNGTYRFYDVGGRATDAQWDIQQYENVFVLLYLTEYGESGGFPIYIQNNGLVNIYGSLYNIQQGGAGCR